MKLSDVDLEKLSPMMQQYVSIKKEYPRHIVFFRLGDFYEMFFDDAILVSRELEITLTGRDCGIGERAPMCGVPHHSSEIYIKRLIEKGFMVVICEQTSDPALSKGIVERGVTKIITPGTLVESSMLDETANNYIACIFVKNKNVGLCFTDISTGEVHLYEFKGNDFENSINNELSCYMPSEILINEGFLELKKCQSFVKQRLSSVIQLMDSGSFNPTLNLEKVLKQFEVDNITELNLDLESIGTYAVCALFAYISDTQKALVGRFLKINFHNDDKVMTLGFTARRNLELTETMRNKERKGSLLWVLDHTCTSMGKRMLKSFIEQPLLNPVKILSRLDAVEQFVKKPVNHSELTHTLSKVYDLERLMTKVMYKTATPRDLKALSLTALKMPELKRCLSDFSDSKLILSLDNDISTLEEIANIIENSIIDEPPITFKDGGVIRDGFNEELDELRSIINGGQKIIDDIECRERENTGIKNLKIGYNRVFGYYIEITKSNYHLTPESYIRKQTLTNCERFITEELKNAENTILGAKDKVNVLESEIFTEIREFISTKLNIVQTTAVAIANLDVLASFATSAIKNSYCKPDLSIDGTIEIKNGRHPVVELMNDDELFVPNDAYLNTSDNRMIIITGPNMSGKSTYMRQIALITLMAQLGSFVPADYARISVVDQIFTRVGASDDLTSGQSTFMVEMSEVSDIVKHATKNSLVILDEVGRGTSTFDGISIARAVSEHIVNSKGMGCKTLFATHYHELIELENELEGVKNFSIAVKRRGDDIKFLRKIVPGGVDQSYGIEVAKLAGLPNKIITRAKELLTNLEKTNYQHQLLLDKKVDQISFEKISESIVFDKIRKLHLDEMSDDDLRTFILELKSYI